MRLKKVEGKTAFDYFSGERFKMRCEGYRRVTEKQLAIYWLLGSQNYRRIVYDAFKHSCIEAYFRGIFPGDKKFSRMCKKMLEDYCLEIRKKYNFLRNDDPDNENPFVYYSQPEKQMWENVKKRVSASHSVSLPLS